MYVNYIDEDTCDFLDPLNNDMRTIYMYFLPKIHKPLPQNLAFMHAQLFLTGTIWNYIKNIYILRRFSQTISLDNQHTWKILSFIIQI